MSGAHDQARDAAQWLLRASTAPATSETEISWFQDEIKTIAKYLGIDVEEDRK